MIDRFGANRRDREHRTRCDLAGISSVGRVWIAQRDQRSPSSALTSRLHTCDRRRASPSARTVAVRMLEALISPLCRRGGDRQRPAVPATTVRRGHGSIGYRWPTSQRHRAPRSRRQGPDGIIGQGPPSQSDHRARQRTSSDLPSRNTTRAFYYPAHVSMAELRRSMRAARTGSAGRRRSHRATRRSSRRIWAT